MDGFLIINGHKFEIDDVVNFLLVFFGNSVEIWANTLKKN